MWNRSAVMEATPITTLMILREDIDKHAKPKELRENYPDGSTSHPL